MSTEVGCRGFARQLLYKASIALGSTGMEKRGAIRNTTEVAEKASRWFWIRRGESWGVANATWIQGKA